MLTHTHMKVAPVLRRSHEATEREPAGATKSNLKLLPELLESKHLKLFCQIISSCSETNLQLFNLPPQTLGTSPAPRRLLAGSPAAPRRRDEEELTSDWLLIHPAASCCWSEPDEALMFFLFRISSGESEEPPGDVYSHFSTFFFAFVRHRFRSGWSPQVVGRGVLLLRCLGSLSSSGGEDWRMIPLGLTHPPPLPRRPSLLSYRENGCSQGKYLHPLMEPSLRLLGGAGAEETRAAGEGSPSPTGAELCVLNILVCQ